MIGLWSADYLSAQIEPSRLREGGFHAYQIKTRPGLTSVMVVVWSSVASGTNGDAIAAYWGNGNHIWNNDGDMATLKRPSGTVADRCHYSDPSETNDHVNC